MQQKETNNEEDATKSKEYTQDKLGRAGAQNDTAAFITACICVAVVLQRIFCFVSI